MDAERFSWLHLTDFHYGLNGQNFLWPTLRKPFLDDLAKVHALSGPWQAVFFTGDFVQSGTQRQFAEMQSEVLDRLWEKLRELGSGKAVLLAVPGNHDLCRPDAGAGNAATDALLDPTKFVDTIAQKFWDNPDGDYRGVVNTAFAEYQKWWSSTPQRPQSGVTAGILPGDFAYTLAHGKRRIGVMGLNTTFLQLKDGDYQGRLVWHPRQVHQLSGGAVDDWVSSHDVCLLLTHQGPDWLTPDSAELGAGEIAPAGRFAVHLFGHMHQTKISYLKVGGGEATRQCQGCSVFGMEKYGDPPKAERTHGYAAGSIEFSADNDAAHLRIWPRIATRTLPRRFIPDYENAVLLDNYAVSPRICQVTAPESISIRSTEVKGRASVKSSAQPAARSTFVAIPKSTWPADLAAKGIEMPDSMLLRPESQVVRFHRFREPLRDTIIGWAVDPDEPIKLRLQAGEGGSGKTRLLIEVCDRLERSHGWRAGFVDKTQSIAIGFSELLAEGKPSLVVLDYAESRTGELVELIKAALGSKGVTLARFVLLAREGGDWWDRIAEAAGNDYAVSGILRGASTKSGPYRMASERIEVKDRGTVFSDALRDFAERKKLPIPSLAPPDLSADFFGHPLFIHLSALAHVRGQPSVDDKELLTTALGHERSLWRRLLSSAALSEDLLPALEQAIALLTLSNGGRSAKRAKALLARTPRLRDLSGTMRTGLFDLLRKIYPLEGGLMGLQPDLLGETLVSETLAHDDELLDAVFAEDSSPEERQYALTVLTRLARRLPEEQRWLRRALERNLIKISEDALTVGVETGSPMPEIHAQVLRSAERRQRQQAVQKLGAKLPNETLNLTNLSVEVRHQAVEFLRENTSDDPIGHHIALSDALSSLALALRSNGRLAEAAAAALEAAQNASLGFHSDTDNDRRKLAAVLANTASHLRGVRRFEEGAKAAERAEGLWRGLAEKHPDNYTANWARALGNLGTHRRDVGRFEEGLQVAEKAEGLWRGLAEKQPDAYTANWARSLGNLANHLSDVGRFEDGLKAAERAELLWRGLAVKQPDDYTADWARSLGSLGSLLSDVGRFEEGLKATGSAERLRRELAEKQPDTYTASWAMSLGNLSNRFREVGRFAEGLKVAEQAERLWRGLAEKQPDAYTANWATSLGNLGNHLSDVGRFEEGLKAAERAERLRRGLAEKQPDAYTASWARSLNNLGSHLSDVGRFEEGLKVAEQAELLRRGLAEKQPDTYIADWATSLGNLGSQLSDLGRFEEGLKAIEQAERLWRELAQKQPDTYSTNWARSLGNLGNRLADVGRLDEGLKAAEHAERLWRELTEKHPDAYTANWATSLSNLGGQLGDLGRSEESLKATEKAEQLRRELARKQPDAYTADWARSLGNLADSLVAVGRFAQGLDAARAALQRINAFAQLYPRVYNPWLGIAHRAAAEALLGMERFDEALAEARQSADIWTEIAKDRQNYESTEVAKTFRILMKCEIMLDQSDAAVAALTHAFRLLRRPLEVNPKPLRPLMSKLLELAAPLDRDAVALAVPSEFLAILNARR